MRMLSVRLVVAVSLVAAACSSRAPDGPPAPPRTQPLALDGTADRAVTSLPDRARVQVDLATARAALRAWHAEHASWPGSLEELRLEGLSYPADLAYDAAAGTVSSRAYPSY